MDVALENPGNGYRRCKAGLPPNLSGKRTEGNAARRGCVRREEIAFCGAAAGGSAFSRLRADAGSMLWRENMEILNSILAFLSGPLNDFAWMYTFLP